MWQYGIENYRSGTANFCEQSQPISWNVPGLMDEWLNGSMAQWLNGSMAQWLNGLMA
jgi:hypothetical protein